MILHFNFPGKTNLYPAGKTRLKKTEHVAYVKPFLVNFSFLLLMLCYSTITKAQDAPLISKALFEKKCATCHGNDGTRGRWGAKNLQTSKLNDDELFATITTGKGIMPKWGKKLTQPQILSVIEYIKTLRK